jgi:hypothetical protein
MMTHHARQQDVSSATTAAVGQAEKDLGTAAQQVESAQHTQYALLHELGMVAARIDKLQSKLRKAQVDRGPVPVTACNRACLHLNTCFREPATFDCVQRTPACESKCL